MVFSNLFPCIYRVCHSLLGLEFNREWAWGSDKLDTSLLVLLWDPVSTSIKIPTSSVIHIVRFTVPLLSCWLERATEKRCPTSPPSSAGPGRGCAEALRTSSVAGTGPSGRDAQPRPRGWKQRGLGAGGRGGALWRSCVWLVRSVRAWGGAGVRNPEVGDLAPRVSPARAALATAPARPVPVREHRGGVQWGGAAPRAAAAGGRVSGGRGGWDAGQRGWGFRGASRLLQGWAWSRGFLARPVWWCQEEGSAVTAPQSEPRFRGRGRPGTVALASWPRAGRTVTIGGSGPARSGGSSPAGRSLPSQVLAAEAVGFRVRAVLTAGSWEPAGRAWRTFPRQPGVLCSRRGGGPARSCLAETQVKWCHLGERRTRSEGSSLAAFCLRGFLCVLRFCSQWMEVFHFRAEEWERLVFGMGVFRVIEGRPKRTKLFLWYSVNSAFVLLKWCMLFSKVEHACSTEHKSWILKSLASYELRLRGEHWNVFWHSHIIVS